MTSQITRLLWLHADSLVAEKIADPDRLDMKKTMRLAMPDDWEPIGKTSWPG
jgi:hypothetical protein